MTTRELGIAPLSALGTSPDEFIYLAHDAGFDFVGLRVIPVTPQEPQFDLSVGSPLHKNVAKALNNTGLKVKDAEFILLDGSDQRDVWMTAMERAASLGAGTLTVAVGDADRARTKDTVSAMVEAGKEFGITPAIEAISYQAVNDIAAAVDIAETGSYFLPDTLHMHRFSATPQQLADAAAHVPMIQICGVESQRPADRDGLVHESRAHRLAPDKGSSDVVGYLRALPYDLPVSVESPNDIFVAEHGTEAWLETLFAAGKKVIEIADSDSNSHK